MNRRDYCTLFDGRFVIQALALWNSILRYEPEARLRVLALDSAAEAGIALWKDARVQVVPLETLERSLPELLTVKSNRSAAEYVFTLSPCWPLWLLENQPEIEFLAYIDTDTAFFGPPAPAWEELGGHSVLITAHRFPRHLIRYEVCGRYNVGLLLYHRSEGAFAVLHDWQRRCLEWCRDHPEGDRYADQKYLDAWPGRFGDAVIVSRQDGLNMGPWNWFGHRIESHGGVPIVDGGPLTLFHFSGFKHVAGPVWDSGQTNYGPMALAERRAIYGAYTRMLESARLDPRLEGRLRHRRASSRSERHPLRRLIACLASGTLWWDPAGICAALGFTALGRWRAFRHAR